MKKSKVLLAMLALFGVSMAQADNNTFVYVQQAGSVVAADGCAAFECTDSKSYTLSFSDDGTTALMKQGDNLVATLPISDGTSALVGDLQNGSGLTAAGSITVAVSSTNYKYSTFYSPFQLTVPSGSGVTVYAPTLNSGKTKVVMNSSNEFVAGTVIPVGTALMLGGTLGTTKSITFTFSDGAVESETTTKVSSNVLKGTAIALTGQSANTVYALGGTDANEGFYKLNSTTRAAAKAWLESSSLNAKSFIGFDFGEPTDIDNVAASTGSAQAPKEGKFIINGKVVIVKGGKKYNLSGQEVK